MIIDANSVDATTIFEADVCIVGGGVAGIVLATELLNSNKKIILIESGNESYDEQTQELYKAESIPPLFPNPVWSRLRMLGGSSNHWENSTERFDPIDFKEREWVRDSGWPISYDDVAMFYPSAEEYCGVGKNGYDFDYWKGRFNVENSFLKSTLFNSVVSKSPLSPTLFFDEYGGGLVSSKFITIIKNANVVDLEYDQKSQTVNYLLFRTLRGIQLKVQAKTFVMCLGGIENARMLLIFNEKYANNLGNQHDNVGRYFMEHPTIRAAHFLPFKDGGLGSIYDGVASEGLHVRGRASLSESAQIKYRTNNMRIFFNKRSKLELSDGISSSHIILDGLDDSEVPNDFGRHLLNVIKDIDHIAESFFKKELKFSFFEDAYEFGGYEIVSMFEQTPCRDNRIKLGGERDNLGLKKIEIDFRVTKKDKDIAWKTLELLAKDPNTQSIGRLRLLKDRDDRIWGSQLGFSQHHMGTTKMSLTPENGVVDSSLKVFGTKNLYMSGSSVFPTGGHVPPTLTIVAITIRLAHELKGRSLV